VSKVLDIVERLRSVLHNDRSVELMNHEAAYEIEQLRNELTERIHMCDMRAEKIIELTAERDEARREVCFLVSESDVYNHISTSPEDVAEEYGWNCFNNHKPKE
jgi:hypothetical protein